MIDVRPTVSAESATLRSSTGSEAEAATSLFSDAEHDVADDDEQRDCDQAVHWGLLVDEVKRRNVTKHCWLLS